MTKAVARVFPAIMIPLLLMGAQQNTGQKSETAIRAAVNLVQTDVMVFDRQGRFVPDLKPEQFELKIAGKPQTVSFCELVSSGSGREGALWADTGAAPAPVRLDPVSPELGRRLIFFVDDWHLSADSLVRTRAALNNLINTSVGISDMAGIFPASGSIGFLQQLSGNKAVLQAAMEKLTLFYPPIVDKDRVPMNETQALAIEQNNTEVISYFVDATIMSFFGRYRPNRAEIERSVRKRAAILAAQSTEIAGRTLAALARIVRLFGPLPGRKVIFFLSDGFVLQYRHPETLRKIREISDAAARAGIMIYSLDTRGLIVGGPDIANPDRPDLSGRLARNVQSEVTSPQDALHALAADTGGAFLRETNALDLAIAKTLKETSSYYLLGWYLERGMMEPGKYRSIRVAVKGRSDLKVRVRQAEVDLVQLAIQGQDGTVMANPAQTDPSDALLQLLRSPLPIGVLPVWFYAGYDLRSDKGFCIAVALHTVIEDTQGAALKTGQENKIDLAGIVLNREGGTVASFSDSLAVPAAADPNTGLREWIYSGVIPVEPGIYHVRAAVRDARTGRSASSLQWLSVPELTHSGIALGSIFMAEAGPNSPGSAGPAPNIFDVSSISVKRRFQKSSQVSYFLHVYDLQNSALLAQTKVYRGNQAIFQSDFEPLNSPALVTGRLPLENFPPGAYVLEVTVRDASRPPATQQISFWVQ